MYTIYYFIKYICYMLQCILYVYQAYVIYYSYINIKICKTLSKVHLEISHTYFYVVIDFSALSRHLFSMTLFYWTFFYISSSWIRWIWWLFTKKLRRTIREWELREESRVLGITRRQWKRQSVAATERVHSLGGKRIQISRNSVYFTCPLAFSFPFSMS